MTGPDQLITYMRIHIYVYSDRHEGYNRNSRANGARSLRIDDTTILSRARRIFYLHFEVDASLP